MSQQGTAVEKMSSLNGFNKKLERRAANLNIECGQDNRTKKKDWRKDSLRLRRITLQPARKKNGFRVTFS